MKYNECKAIAELDLEPIKVKLMHQESGEGWTLEQANAVEAEYRRFLYLMKMFPHEAAAPLMDVDTFWHYHILDTIKYARDCETVFGYFLHHFPYVGLRNEDDLAAHEQMGDRMRELYEATFGEKYRMQPPDQAVQATAYSAAPAAAYSAAPSQPARTSEIVISSAARIAYSAAPARPRGGDAAGMRKLGPATAEFFSIRPRLESPTFA
jgi:Glycine-rich domain-containing protein-like